MFRDKKASRYGGKDECNASTNDAVEDSVLQARGKEALGLEMIGMAVDRPPVEAVAADTGELQPDFDKDSTSGNVYISRYFQGTLPTGTGDVVKTLAAQFTTE